MIIMIKVVGILMIVMGVLGFVNTDWMKRMTSFFEEGKRLYIVGVLRLVFAAVFFMGASLCREPVVIRVFAVLMLIGGVLNFALKLEKQRAMINWFKERSSKAMRVWAGVALAAGVLVLYAT